MIIVLKPNANAKQVENLTHWLRSSGFDLHTSVGAQHTILGLVGDTSRLDIDLLGGLDVVESVQAHSGAVQERQPQVPRRGHGGGRGRRKDRRRAFHDDRRALLRGERAARSRR